MNIADKVKADFEAAILAAFEYWERDFYEPTMLFSRNRKLDKVTMVKLLCLMGGNSLRKELYDYPGLKVSASSFSERRAAIRPKGKGSDQSRKIGKIHSGKSRRQQNRELYKRQNISECG